MKKQIIILFALLFPFALTSCTPSDLNTQVEGFAVDSPPSQEEEEDPDPND